MTASEISRVVEHALANLPLTVRVASHFPNVPTSTTGWTITVKGAGVKLTLIARENSLVAHFVPSWYKDGIASTHTFPLDAESIKAKTVEYFDKATLRKARRQQAALNKLTTFRESLAKQGLKHLYAQD